MAQRVEAVVWDVGRVLVRWDIAALYGRLIADPVERAWFLAHVVTESWHMQHDAGVSFAEMVAARSAEFPAYAPLIEAYAERWLDTLPGPVAGTHAIVEELAARGVPQFSITNFGADAWAMFRPTFPVLDHFRDIVVSGHERLVKPDAAIFDLAVRRFGHAADRMLFIDDSAVNIAAARALGWQTHHFQDDPAVLRAGMEAQGLFQVPSS